ncbi:MAG: SAM-dependent methyltransferase [Bacteroidia bacterium]|nr:MAG: SAM-dependent methyltransferase [Bacteroidia bacterium]
MERSLRLTDDGSHTLYVDQLDEPYHSSHGALQESMHVFIKQGLQTLSKPTLRILEIGFGTGLNALLTMRFVKQNNLLVHYHAVEKYPLTRAEYAQLNFEELIDGVPKGFLNLMHDAEWERPVQLSDRFTLFKEKADFRSMNPPGYFDLIYFDAFSPDKQPELWSKGVFSAIQRSTLRDVVLVTYSSKGVVRRTLISCGFNIEKVPGPPGKREMIRAVRI